MKKGFLTFVFLFAIMDSYSQNLVGAWQTTLKDSVGVVYKNIVIISENHQVSTWYNAETGAFHSTNGGLWSVVGNKLTEIVEFNSEHPDLVGSKVIFDIEIRENSFNIVGNKMIWNRIDDGSPGKLAGAWLMSGRKRNGEIQNRNTNQPRKTMKILSGTRFQWIAYNTETKKFMGTGGGNYTTINGKYTENIEFFSRDNSRVGASLEFDSVRILPNDWHHSGFSSKGDALYEIWSLRKN